MKRKMFGNKIRKIVLPLAVVFIVVGMAGITVAYAADAIKFDGQITNSDGSGVSGAIIEITRNGETIWSETEVSTNSGGYYYIPPSGYIGIEDKGGVYRLYVGGAKVQEKDSSELPWRNDGHGLLWSCEWNHEYSDPEMPEFTTIALPAAAILGLLFFFNHRRRRTE